MVRDHACQRHRQVIAQRQFFLASGMLRVKDQLLGIFAVLAHERLAQFEDGGLQRLEAVRGVDTVDDGERALPGFQLGGEEVARPRGRVKLHGHAPMVPPSRAGPRQD